MKRYTLQEIREELGISGTRIVNMARDEREHDGHYIRMKKKPEGGAEFWLEPVDGSTETAEEVTDDDALEAAKARVEGGDDWREVREDLDEEQTSKLVEWMTEQGIDMSPDGVAVASEVTIDWLTDIDGIGKKGAGKLIEHLENEGIDRSFAAVAEIDDLTELPSIGKKNGANLREALEAELPAEPVDRCEHCGARMSPKVTGVMCLTCMKDTSKMEDGEGYPEGYGSEADEVDATEVEETEADHVEIYCPHCDELFDRAPLGHYEQGIVAQCDDVEGNGDYGDCFEEFWLQPTAEGYETYKEKPADVEESDADPDYVYGFAAHRFDDPLAAMVKLDKVVGQVDDLTAERLEKEYPSLQPTDIEEKSVEYWVEFFTFDINDVQPAQEAAALEADADVIDMPVEDKTVDSDTHAENVEAQGGVAKQQRSEPEPLPGTVIERAERHHPMLPECRFLGKAEHDTDEWHSLRARGIGSSDAGAIMGFSDHATNQDVWATKIGEEPDEKPWLEPYADFGQWFEPYVIHHIEDVFGIEIVRGDGLGTLQWTGWGKALANIDALDVTNGVIEEIKTSSEKWDQIPLGYEAQVQHQMMVTGAHEARIRQFVCHLPRASFPSLLEAWRRTAMMPEVADRALADWLLEHGELHTYVVERDESYIRRMLARQRAFWEHVEMEIIPPMADPDGTVDITEDADAYAAMCAYGRVDREWSDVAKPIKKARRAKKDKARRAIERAVGLDYGPEDKPKRIKVADHKATLSKSSAGNEYWRLYPGEEDVLMEVSEESASAEDSDEKEVANG